MQDNWINLPEKVFLPGTTAREILQCMLPSMNRCTPQARFSSRLAAGGLTKDRQIANIAESLALDNRASLPYMSGQ
jgi:hypothetical protein